MNCYDYKPMEVLIKAGHLPNNKQLLELVEDWQNGRIARGARGKHFAETLKFFKKIRKNPRSAKWLLEQIETKKFSLLLSNRLPNNSAPKKIIGRPPQFWDGFNFACQLLEDLGYTKLSTHDYNIADCLKSKMNRLPKSKIRRNIK